MDLSSSIIRKSRGLGELSEQQKDQISSNDKSKDTDGVRISNSFKDQLCQAFKVQDLDQLQQLLPYQPTAPQPSLSRKKERTYYENDLIYTAAASDDSASEASDRDGMILQRSSLRAQISPQSRRPNTDVRAQYLLQSCITQPADQRYLTQLHCDWDFFEASLLEPKVLAFRENHSVVVGELFETLFALIIHALKLCEKFKMNSETLGRKIFL